MSTLPLSNASSSNHQLPTGFDPQEPIWTAYLLDELEGAERAALDRIVAGSPAAQSWIKEMRALAGDLKVGLATEPLPALTADQRQGLAAASRSPVAATPPLSLDRLPVGTRLRVAPNHVCMTAAMYDRYHVVDGGDEVVAVWDRINGW